MSSGENAFLRWLLETRMAHASLSVPLGDDAAVWDLPGGDRIVLAADAIAEGAHFAEGTEPRLVGRKALAVNLSDLAAMGAEPLCALATCTLPRGFEDDLPREITRGMRALAEEVGCPLIGGDTITHDGGIVLSVTALGTPLPGGPVTRAGARAGDLIAVTGALGGSGHGRHLTFEPRLAASRRLLELGPPCALMDISDGLLIDLHRMADASGTGFLLAADDVPVHADARREGSDGERRALEEGEDFELLFTAPREAMQRVMKGWDLDLPVTIIGEMTSERRTMTCGEVEEDAPRAGHEHR